MTDTRRYRPHEFADLAGVTVRTLHHYDRVGLLRARRDETGFRVYTSADLERLENIIALKSIGLPLKQIAGVLSADKRDLSCVLRSQLSALEEKKRRLDVAIETIRAADAALRSGEKPCLKRIIEVMQMQNEYGWILQHFSEGARRRVQDRLASTGLDRWAELQTLWTGLAADIHAAADGDPATAESQALLRRWEDLIRQTTAGDEELVHGLKSLYSDRDHWPEGVRDAMFPLSDERILDFLGRAVAARAN